MVIRVYVSNCSGNMEVGGSLDFDSCQSYFGFCSYFCLTSTVLNRMLSVLPFRYKYEVSLAVKIDGIDTEYIIWGN